MKSDTLLAAPPVGVVGLSLFGIALSQWVLILTAVYTIFLIVDKLPVVVARLRSLYRWVKGL